MTSANLYQIFVRGVVAGTLATAAAAQDAIRENIRLLLPNANIKLGEPEPYWKFEEAIEFCLQVEDVPMLINIHAIIDSFGGDGWKFQDEGDEAWAIWNKAHEVLGIPALREMIWINIEIVKSG